MKRYFLVLVLASLTSTATAQLHCWGIFDFEARKGGKDSGLETNGLPNEYPQLNLQQLHLFIEGDISPTISFTAKLANDPAKALDFKSIEIQLAYVSFSRIFGDALSISLGRIMTPFGTFSKRQLPSENPFIGQPLFFSYSQNISPLTGYLNPQVAYPSGTQYGNLYGNRLTTIYTCGYYTGVGANGYFFDKLLEYDVALMNAPLSSATGDYNIDKELAFHGRAALHPAIWGTLGVSYATGSYMQPSSYSKDFEEEYASLNNFKQSTYGIDLLLSYLYFEVNAEYIMNRFDAPYILYTPLNQYDNGYAIGFSRTFDSYEYLIDAKLESPFFPGLYLALRYNYLTFNSIMDPRAGYSSYYYNNTFPWDRNVLRSAIGIGYKPERSVLIKLGYERTAVDTQPVPDLAIWGCAVVVTIQ